MPETITAREANQQFSRVLREVQAGKEYVVTRNGVAVARIVPEKRPDGLRTLTADQEAALARSMERLETGWDLGTENVGRDEIYDDARSWMPRFK